MRKATLAALLMCSCATAPARPTWTVEFPRGDEHAQALACLHEGNRLECYDLAAFLRALAQHDAEKQAAQPSVEM